MVGAMRVLLVFVVGLLACKGDPPFHASVYAKVVDDRLELELYGPRDLTVTIPGQPPTPLDTLEGSPPKLSVPLEGFKDGENTLEVKFEQRGQVVTQTVTFTKPPGAGKPFVRIAECKSSGTSSGHAKLDAGDLGKVDYCWAWSDGNIRVVWKGSVGGKLTVGDQTVDIGKDGKVEIAYPLRPLLLRAPVRSALSDGAGIATQVPVMFAKGTTKLEGKLTIDLSRAAGDLTKVLFSDAASGTPISGDAANRSKNSLVYLSAATYRAAKHFGRQTTVAEVGLVAVAHDLGAPRDGSKCGPYASTRGAPGDGMAPRDLIDVQVVVIDATSGQKLGSRDFKADNRIECPILATSKGSTWETIKARPDKAVEAWLTQVAANGGP